MSGIEASIVVGPLDDNLICPIWFVYVIWFFIFPSMASSEHAVKGLRCRLDLSIAYFSLEQPLCDVFRMQLSKRPLLLLSMHSS